MSDQSHDPTKVWAFGIKEPGWYCARNPWNKEYADHLTSLGYRVERSIEKPVTN